MSSGSREGGLVVTQGPVTGGRQSAPRAELQAAVHAVCTHKSTALGIDCAYVVEGGSKLAKLASSVRVNGDLWLLLQAAALNGHSFFFRKVKGHNTIENCKSHQDLVDFVCNNAVDTYAKAAVAPPGEGVFELEAGVTANLVRECTGSWLMLSRK